MSKDQPQGFLDFRGMMPKRKSADQVATERILRQAQDDERVGPAFTADIRTLEAMTKQKIQNMRELERQPLLPRKQLYRPQRR